MGTKLQKDRKIIDVFTMKVHDISSNMMIKCKELDIDYTCISKVEKGIYYGIKSRYTTPQHLNKIFTLIDIDTNKEYNCIDNYSLFIQIGLPYLENDSKYIYELKSGRQINASICGKIFSLKGGKKGRYRTMKNNSQYLDAQRKLALKRRIIKYRISKRIWQAMQDIDRKKDNLTENLIGCNMLFFMEYISNQFIDGMNWDNYGKKGWHLDHIKPCNSFDLTNKEEQKQCFHYSNIQPLWATTEIALEYGHKNYIGNMNKSDRY